MLFPASSLTRLSRFPLSRCLFVFEEIRDRALLRDVAVITGLAAHGTLWVQEALDLDRRQRALRTTRFPPQAREIDQLVDGAVTGLDSYCDSQVTLFRGQTRAAAAARLKRALLPEGVASITQLPYTDQHKQIDALLARAQSPEVAADLAILSEMTVMLAHVRELNGQYGAMLRESEELLTRQDVRDRHDECQELLCALAGLIVGHFATMPERHADRDYLLEPILRENEALRERRRRRRADGDDDQDPDVVLPEPDDDGGTADRVS